MKRSVCLVCLNTFDGPDLASKKDGIPSSVPLLTRFLKFAENYLELPSVTTQELLLRESDGVRKEAFCERCEVSVINPICQVYLELLSSQLRLSSQLEQLGKLLDDSKISCSDKLRILNMNALSNQLGIGSLHQLEGFRTSLAQKCHSKRKQTLPNVLLTSRRHKEQIDTTENDDSSFLHNLEQIKVDVDPLDLVEMEADNNALDLEPSPSSVEGQNGEEEANGRIPVGSVLKFVTLHDDVDAEELLELPSTRVKDLDLEVIPAAVQAMTWVDGIFSNGYQCPRCSEVLRDEQKYHDHYRYHHQEAGIYQCQLCSRVYDTPLQLKKHVDSIVHRHEHEEEPLRCPHCDASFNMNGNLRQHIRAVHQPGKFTCPHCPTSMVFTTNKYLRAHIRKYHPQHFIAGKPRNPDNLSSTEKQKAEGEGETIGRVQVRTVNWKVTLPNVLLNSGCGEAQTSVTLNGESSIEDNLEIARGDPIARDATHDNSFILPQDEPISIERQNNEGEAIGTVTELIENENDDDEIRIRFKTQKIAHNHFKHHHQRAIEERHVCVYCGMVYDTPRKLRRHITEIHTHKRARCPHCDASFQRKSNLAQHIRAVHQPGKFPCPHCTQSTPMVFTAYRYLRAHIRRQHPQKYCLEEKPVNTSGKSVN